MKHIYCFILVGAVALAVLSSCRCFGTRIAGLSEEEINQKVDSLLSQLSIEEKASLMMNASAAVERLGIKQYNWWNEALHGVARNGSATVFPQPIGMAASFDESLIYQIFTAVSDEARVKNRIANSEGYIDIYEGLTFWTPNINLFRDPRWGRGMETYGEDPYLTGTLGMAVVRGLQGSDDSPVRKAHACAKHYAVHSGPESSRHSFDAVVSERDLRETYLPAFKDLVTKAKVEEVMTAYNSFRGMPCGANDYLMNGILRGEWNFKGIVTSDCSAVGDFYKPGHHGTVKTATEAAALAVKTGIDTECGKVYRHIPEAVEQGLLSEKDIDRNLGRLFKARYKLGEMDDLDPWSYLPDDIVEGPEHKAMSLKMAKESFVLLQNKDDILPLAAGTKIAVVGPNADDEVMMWGNYNAIPESTITLLEGLKAEYGEVKYVRGCGLVGAEYKSKDCDYDIADIFEPTLDIADVLNQLEGYDTVIFAGGISPRLEGEEMSVLLPGFSGGDRTDIELPQVQRTLIGQLHLAGKKVILVNFSGSAIGLVPETETCDAILQVWYPGQEGGTAIADVIYGKTSPSGKLPVTFYKSVCQLPEFDNYDMAGHTYRFFKGEPLFAFGYGLSYTRFEYGEARLGRGKIIIPVTNAGGIDADEIVQLYVSRPDDALSPIRTLRGFKRVSIPAGKTVKVTIPLDEETFTWWDEAAQDMVPLAGTYKLEYGSSSRIKDLKSLIYTF